MTKLGVSQPTPEEEMEFVALLKAVPLEQRAEVLHRLAVGCYGESPPPPLALRLNPNWDDALALYQSGDPAVLSTLLRRESTAVPVAVRRLLADVIEGKFRPRQKRGRKSAVTQREKEEIATTLDQIKRDFQRLMQRAPQLAEEHGMEVAQMRSQIAKTNATVLTLLSPRFGVSKASLLKIAQRFKRESAMQARSGREKE